ncbi:MAG: response regulator transcription factor [Candidatus Obscuribacterales bacterium]|nr:response regulator transcription factor [Candidatus Obscuribacterales bacterium]
MSKALIIEDDPNVANTLAELLRHSGWTIETTNNGADGLQLISQFSYDLVLLDWCLPDLTGLELCTRYRASGGTMPIIFITGQNDVADIESGLDAGSNDYITKPFEKRELMARIRNVMRQPRGIATVDVIRISNITFDSRRRLISSETKVAQFTAVEYNLIEYLLRNKGESFTTDQLFNAIWQSDSNSSEETVRVHIRVVRRKLELAGLPALILHRRGFGYSLEEPS